MINTELDDEEEGAYRRSQFKRTPTDNRMSLMILRSPKVELGGYL